MSSIQIQQLGMLNDLSRERRVNKSAFINSRYNSIFKSYIESAYRTRVILKRPLDHLSKFYFYLQKATNFLNFLMFCCLRLHFVKWGLKNSFGRMYLKIRNFQKISKQSNFQMSIIFDQSRSSIPIRSSSFRKGQPITLGLAHYIGSTPFSQKKTVLLCSIHPDLVHSIQLIETHPYSRNLFTYN